MTVKVKTKQDVGRRLKRHQRLLLPVIVFLIGIWTRTLRFRLDDKARSLIRDGWPISIFVLWHNRLFVAPAFARRYLSGRKLAPLVSASGDGVWLTAFLKSLGMRPVNGSRHNRGSQAVRDLIKAGEAGFDIVITPDGSQGPIYDMKQGAVALAIKTSRPIVLFSFNFSKACRLKTWDRLYLPIPFSSIEVKMERVELLEESGSEDLKTATILLKRRLDAITEDDERHG